MGDFLFGRLVDPLIGYEYPQPYCIGVLGTQSNQSRENVQMRYLRCMCDVTVVGRIRNSVVKLKDKVITY